MKTTIVVVVRVGGARVGAARVGAARVGVIVGVEDVAREVGMYSEA